MVARMLLSRRMDVAKVFCIVATKLRWLLSGLF